MKKKTIKIPLYFGTVEMIVVKDLTELNSRTNFDLFGFEACVFPEHHKSGLSKYVIAFEPNPPAKIIAHECFHLVTNVFHDRGITIDNLNDEPAAYLLGYFVDEVHKFIHPKKKKK